MQDQQTFLEPPPPYRAHSNSAYYLSDNDAWPSSYYRNTPRVDLAKFYHDILKASADNNNNNNEHNGNQYSQEVTHHDRRVTFSEEAPQIFEYEAEYDTPKQSVHGRSLDDGWPGRAKTAMKSSAFIDFKSKIEAKLSAVNDDSELISEIKNMDCSSNSYRYKKSPLVQRLNLRPIPNENYSTDEENESPCDSPPPETPSDTQPLNFHSHSSSSTSSNSSISSTPNRMSWLRALKLKSAVRSK